jgi:copper homeostasis protein
MERDIKAGKELGVDGFVFGVLREDGTVDIQRTQRLVELSFPKRVTFHRAFDMTRDLDEALESVIQTGADRLLTSGGAPIAAEGVPTIAAVVNAARGRISVMAGSGISRSNVSDLIQRTGVREIHASARVQVDSPMRFRRETIAMGSVREAEYKRATVLQDDVRLLLEAANQAI